jgi:hypothetical protein
MMKLSKHAPLLMALAALAPFAAAQYRHPSYLHARSDLRRATLLMRIPDEPNVNRDMAAAADFTEHAIHELDIAARWDRKDLDEHPPIDTHMGRGGRFKEILRLLDSARHDIEHEEDNPAAREWRNRAFRNIDDAMALIRKGGYDKFRDEVGGGPPPPAARLAPAPMPAIHPAYLHAISALGWEGRFRKAMELLNSAEHDLSEAETNGAAAGWRNAALGNVRNAKGFVGKAMRDSWWR